MGRAISGRTGRAVKETVCWCAYLLQAAVVKLEMDDAGFLVWCG